jgi:DNA-binding winged helix-turn-helix (wHTH) protein
MDASHSSAKVFRFGVFEAKMRGGELRCDGTRIHLQGQPFLVLALLLERAGELVTREELREHVWPENTFVEFDYALNTAIKKIRAVLGDDASTPRYVETVPRRGYRFIAPVSVAHDNSCRQETSSTERRAPAHMDGGARERPLLIGMIITAFVLGYLVRRAPL